MKRFYAILGVLSTLLGILCLPFRTVRVGALMFLPLAACLGLMALFLTLRDSGHKYARVFRALAVLGHFVFGLWVISLAAVQGLIWSNGLHADEEADRADYLLVLGAGIYDDQPGKTLACRLETARQQLEANPNQIAILCGGQGFDEIMPESTVMKNWLIERGISPDRLIEENRSRNTVENIANAKALAGGLPHRGADQQFSSVPREASDGAGGAGCSRRPRTHAERGIHGGIFVPRVFFAHQAVYSRLVMQAYPILFLIHPERRTSHVRTTGGARGPF